MGYLGAVIGAGFASGQEVMQFFVVFGVRGYYGGVAASVLFVFLAFALLNTAYKHGISNYQDLIKKTAGIKAAVVLDFSLAVFLFLGLGIMLSASGAVFAEHLNLPRHLGIILGYLAVITALWRGKNGLVASYNILVPVKVLLLAAINVYLATRLKDQAAAGDTVLLAGQSGSYWLMAAVLYVAYNFTLAMVILTEYQSVVPRRQGLNGAIIGGSILGLLLMLNITALISNVPAVFSYEVPMLYLAGKISSPIKIVYLLVLWLGIITTAIADTYGFTQRAARISGLHYNFTLVLTATLAIPIAFFSFADLVGMVYPMFGIIGIIIIAGLVNQYIKDVKN